MKVKAKRSFNSVTGHVSEGQIFDLPIFYVSDYTLAGLVVENVEPPKEPEDRHEIIPGYKTMKTKRK